MERLIFKFGGTSLATPKRMQHVANIINGENTPKVIVLSAVAGTTNTLIALGNLLLAKDHTKAVKKIEQFQQDYYTFVKDLYYETYFLDKALEVIDRCIRLMNNYLHYPFGQSKFNELLAQGELLSSQLFSLYLSENSVPNTVISALDYLHLNNTSEPNVGDIANKFNALMQNSSPKELIVTQGYICLNNQGDVDNLKRGGSDYTASLLGAALQAKEIQIWTDIDGMHNNDPRVVKNTKPIQHLSFDEAAELAYFGAKILHPATILPAQQAGVPVRLKNTMNPKAQGTLINKGTNQKLVKAVAAKDNITAIKIKSSRMLLAHGFLVRVFAIFDRYQTAIDMVTTSEIAVSLTIDDTSKLQEIKAGLEELGEVEIDDNQSIICLVGSALLENQNALQLLFKSFKNIPVRMVSLGGSKNNVSILVPTAFKQTALQKINNGVFNL